MIGARLGARLWWGLAPLLVLLWGTGALALQGLPGIPTTPLVTQIAVPVVNFSQDVALAVALGTVITMLWSSRDEVSLWAASWIVASIALVAASAVLLQSDATASRIGVDAPELLKILVDTTVGKAVLVQAACLSLALAMIVVGRAVNGTGPIWVAVVLVATGVAAPAVAGHAGLSGEHQVAGISTGIHAVAISCWVGALAAVSARCLREPDEVTVLLPRFSLLAAICVIIAAETGLMSAALTMASLSELVGSTYGSLIILKVALLTWLVRLGWLQRRRAVDRLPDASVPGTVARIASIELIVMALAISAAVVMVRIGPPPIPLSGIAPLSIVSLGIIVPMLMARIRPSKWRLVYRWPEATMVVFLIVIVETGGVGLLGTVAGGFGLLIELIIVLATGWLACCAACSSTPAMVIGALGWPLALVINGLMVQGSNWRMTVIAIILGEMLLLLGSQRLRMWRFNPAQVSQLVAR